MQKSSTSLIKHIPDFLDYCEVEKGLADNTQKNYQRYLEKFSSWLRKTNKQDLKPHEFTPDDIWAYRLYLSRSQDEKGHSLKKISQNYYLIALRAFLSYFSAKNLSAPPADKIALPKDARAEKTVKFLNLEQIEKLLNAPDATRPDGLRDRAILETLFSTGLRIAELVALNRDKGSHPRTVYFSGRALEWIRQYLDTRKDKEKPLFTNFRARKDADSRLTSRSIERIVKKYAVVAGIPIFTTPHTLRHSMATDLLTQGVDIRSIQEFLGHRNIVTTQVYTHVTNKRLRDIHRKYHGGKDLKK